jgi:hypothetical protein
MGGPCGVVSESCKDNQSPSKRQFDVTADFDGYIIAADMSDVPREELLGEIVVAWKTPEKRLLVSRLLRIDHTDALVSDQREYQTVSLSPESHWRIVGRVLWWTGRPR